MSPGAGSLAGPLEGLLQHAIDPEQYPLPTADRYPLPTAAGDDRKVSEGADDGAGAEGDEGGEAGEVEVEAVDDGDSEEAGESVGAEGEEGEVEVEAFDDDDEEDPAHHGARVRRDTRRHAPPPRHNEPCAPPPIPYSARHCFV